MERRLICDLIELILKLNLFIEQINNNIIIFLTKLTMQKILIVNWLSKIPKEFKECFSDIDKFRTF